MTEIEALVWLVGIITTGVTIRYTVGALAKGNKVLEEIRWDFRKIVATLEEGKNEDESAPEGR
jgi:nitrate reductase gamma subunit